MVMIMNNKLRGSLALLIGTVIWGSAFIAQSVGMDYIGPFTFQAARCALGALFLLPIIFLFEQDKRLYLRNWANPRLWKTGFLCGFALFVAAGLQQMGLVYTTAGKAGFITAMYIVIVPILGLFFREKPPVTVWIGVALAVTGLYLLSCISTEQINLGDILMVGSAFGFAVQITIVDRLAQDLDGLRLNCVQAFFCALFSAIVMVFTETPTVSAIMNCALPIGYAGIMSMGVAYSLQIIGQKHLEPAPASLIMSLESVFAVLCAWLFLHERMSTHEIIGCVLVFSAVLLSQIPNKKTHD